MTICLQFDGYVYIQLLGEQDKHTLGLLKRLCDRKQRHNLTRAEQLELFGNLVQLGAFEHMRRRCSEDDPTQHPYRVMKSDHEPDCGTNITD